MLSADDCRAILVQVIGPDTVRAQDLKSRLRWPTLYSDEIIDAMQRTYAAGRRDTHEALREPTEAMIKDGQSKMYYDSEEAVPDIFRAMIDAAMKD